MPKWRNSWRHRFRLSSGRAPSGGVELPRFGTISYQGGKEIFGPLFPPKAIRAGFAGPKVSCLRFPLRAFRRKNLQKITRAQKILRQDCANLYNNDILIKIKALTLYPPETRL